MIYFDNWQRKVGCGLLALACAMSSLWIRSLWRKDGFEIIPGLNTDLIISSNDGYFDCKFRRFGQPDVFAEYNVAGWFSVERQRGNNEGVLPRIQARSFNHVAIVDGYSTIFPSKSHELIVPYPATTVFVTMLSAVLLLGATGRSADKGVGKQDIEPSESLAGSETEAATDTDGFKP